MTALEVCLIVVGIVAIAISYFISEKNAEERMKKAVEELILSEETKQTLIKQARDTVEETLNGMSEEVAEKAEIQLEKLSNEKIMAVHDYSDTVLEEIGKNHHEVMFLYSMLDDKDKEVKDTVKEVQKAMKSIHEVNSSQIQGFSVGQFHGQTEWYTEHGYGNSLSESNKNIEKLDKNLEKSRTEDLEKHFEKSSDEKSEKTLGESNRNSNKNSKQSQNRGRGKRSRKKIPEKRNEAAELIYHMAETYIEEKENDSLSLKEEKTEGLEKNEDKIRSEDKKREAIIKLYQQGKSQIEIAKEMGLGRGEVKLVIDLYYASEESKGNIE